MQKQDEKEEIMKSKLKNDEELMRLIMSIMIYDYETSTAFAANYVPLKIENYSRGLEISKYKTRKLMKKLEEMGLVKLVNYYQEPRCSYEGEWDFDRIQFYGNGWTQVDDIDEKAKNNPWLKQIIDDARAEANRQINEVFNGHHDEDDYECGFPSIPAILC